jgi:hypothetical protein
MSTNRNIEVRKKDQNGGGGKPSHALYFAFANAKSATIEVARQIIKDLGINAPADVRRFVDEFGRK